MLPIIMPGAGEEAPPARLLRRGGRFRPQTFLDARADSACACLARRSRFAIDLPLLEATFNSTTRPGRVRQLARRPSQTNGIPAARNACSRGLGSSFLGSTYWSAFGGHLLTSPIERSMST